MQLLERNVPYSLRVGRDTSSGEPWTVLVVSALESVVLIECELIECGIHEPTRDKGLVALRHGPEQSTRRHDPKCRIINGPRHVRCEP
jgi:hypothetical protein